MKGIFVQVNRRSGLAVLLAGVMLAITAAPSLAWEDRGGADFQATHGKSKVSVNHGTPEFPWSLARAE